MPFNPLAGKQANVAIGSVTYAFDSVSPEFKNGLSKITNFTSNGFSLWLSGINDGKINLSGPYDAGNTALMPGGNCTTTIFYSPSINVVIPGIVESISPDVKVEDAERIKVVIQSNGSFNITVA